MERKLKLLEKKHALIEKKLEKMESFGEFTRKVSCDYPDQFSDKSELLSRYTTLKGTNDRLEHEKEK